MKHRKNNYLVQGCMARKWWNLDSDSRTWMLKCLLHYFVWFFRFIVVVFSSCVLNLFSHVWLFVPPWTLACQTPLSLGVLQARILEWVAMPSSRRSSQPRDQIRVSCTAGRFCTTESPGKPLSHLTPALKIHGRLLVSFQSLPFLPKPVQVESCDEKPHKPSLTLQVSPFHLVSKNWESACPNFLSQDLWKGI